MSFISWKEEYEIGIDQVDDQHQMLVGLLNEFYDAMDEGRGRDEVGTVIADLEEYVEFHFNSEEAFATDCGFSTDCHDCHLAHQNAHEEFATQVSELRAMYEDDDATVHMKTLRFLREWVTEHIGEMDQQLGLYANDEVDPEELEPIEMSNSLHL